MKASCACRDARAGAIRGRVLFRVDADGQMNVNRLTGMSVLALAALLGCARTTEQSGPPLPFDEEGACPFLCCTYRAWTVDWDTDVRSERRDDAPVAYHAAL